MPVTMIRLNLVKGLGPMLQIAEGWTVKLPDEVSDKLWKRTDYTCLLYTSLMFLTSGEFDQKMADTADQIPADPSNTAPAIMSGTVEALVATKAPLSWNMGLNDNSELKTSFKAVSYTHLDVYKRQRKHH